MDNRRTALPGEIGGAGPGREPSPAGSKFKVQGSRFVAGAASSSYEMKSSRFKVQSSRFNVVVGSILAFRFQTKSRTAFSFVVHD